MTCHESHVTCQQTWKRTIFFTPVRFEQKLFYPWKCVNCDKSEFATMEREMYLTTSISIKRLPLIYKGNNCVLNKKISFDSKIKKYQIKTLSITQKNAKLRHNSLLQQNSLKFGTQFTGARKTWHQYCGYAGTFFHLCVSCDRFHL